jgi:hypothetical protein
MMKGLYLVVAIVFSLFCYWQFNDFEQYGTALWYIWALTYGGAAALSLLACWRYLPTPLYIALATITLAVAILRATDIQWGQVILYNEHNPAGNETGGLLIVASWLLLLAWQARREATSSRVA